MVKLIGAPVLRQRLKKLKHNIFQQAFIWLQSFIERRLNRAYIQFTCLLVLAVFLVVFLISFATSVRGHTIFGPYLGADFGAVYVAGKIFTTQSPGRIYDSTLQDRLYREEFPKAPSDSHLPYVNAPFFVLPFTLLSRLPYSWAYLCWVILSLSLFLVGFKLIWKSLDGIPRAAGFAALLLAVSFMPFLMECLAGGQTSAVGFFCFAVAITSERHRRQILGGLALSLCLYKPTLLLLTMPMLVVTRRSNMLLGFIIGSLVLTLVSFAAVGWQGISGFINTLISFTDASTSSASGLRSWKYADINSFFRPLLQDYSTLRWMLTGGTLLIGLAVLIKTWWLSDRTNRLQQDMVWALTISGTLVLNLYVGIYDVTLVVLSVLLTSSVLYQRAVGGQTSLPSSYKLILLLLYLVPWISQPVARLTGVQILTLVLASLVAYQLVQYRQLRSPGGVNKLSAATR